MKNVSSIFSEVSILNIGFLIKLARKYLWISISIPVIIFSISIYFYLRQYDIHMAKISFRNIAAYQDSPTMVIANLLGEKPERITANEIVGMGKSVDFLQRVAERLVKDPEFENLSFDSIYSTKRTDNIKIFADCLDDDCKVQRLRGMIGGFFTIDFDELVNNRFVVTVKTIDQLTTTKLIEAIRIAFVDYRTDSIRHSLSQQRTISEKLIVDRKTSLEDKGILEKNERKTQLESRLVGIEEKLKLYQETLDAKKIELSQASISLRLTKSTMNTEVDQVAKQQWEKYQALRIRRDLLVADITALDQAPTSATNQDQQILTDLKTEQKRINAEIEKLEATKIVANFEGFKADKGKNKDYVEFQSKVLKNQIQELEVQVGQIYAERDELISNIKEIALELEEHRPSLDYLKLLEQKLLQLRLVEGTVVSDIIFDNFIFENRHFKRHGLMAIIPFSLLISIFLSVVALLIRYLFDERIIDREDFKNNFRDIEILGDVPEL